MISPIVACEAKQAKGSDWQSKLHWRRRGLNIGGGSGLAAWARELGVTAWKRVIWVAARARVIGLIAQAAAGGLVGEGESALGSGGRESVGWPGLGSRGWAATGRDQGGRHPPFIQNMEEVLLCPKAIRPGAWLALAQGGGKFSGQGQVLSSCGSMSR